MEASAVVVVVATDADAAAAELTSFLTLSNIESNDSATAGLLT